MYPIFITHLSADGHLGCFHFLVVGNIAAINMNEKQLHSWICREMVYMGHTVHLLLGFRETSAPISTEAAPVHTPTRGK